MNGGLRGKDILWGTGRRLIWRKQWMRKWERRGVESVRPRGRTSCIPTLHIPPELAYSHLSAIQRPPTHIKIQSSIRPHWPLLTSLPTTLFLACCPLGTLSSLLLLELSKHVPLTEIEPLLFPLLGKLYPQSLLRFTLSICSHLPSDVTLEPLVGVWLAHLPLELVHEALHKFLLSSLNIGMEITDARTVNFVSK